jgi:hypothetical protein
LVSLLLLVGLCAAAIWLLVLLLLKSGKGCC